ncbi:enoyl-CoA hydratase-related protein [Microbulbifer rhizosphaerae]|uniref:Putative two-component system hydrogenase maturation factor HypX/HoxX n=1 Tax=Microbulbifer rhizosphaerae TaxID=1562603 RepID=A0A7W4ZAC4_9GAMM|nr:enoyl-CoA hydratase-related protein [Microbulbifer rhizosphaerae]MBB3062607.1 putative two-component system hydrogenase maturation factor HypX/HoxX [Microbulbifer rhizosphaerae]
MRVLLLCSAFNGISQRIHRELELHGCQVSVELATGETGMENAVAEFRPRLIVCPYLVHRIPDAIWQKIPCLVLRPGIESDRGLSSLDWAIASNCTEWGVTLLQANGEMGAGDIWGTATFPLRGASKAGLYRREVTAAAASLVKSALAALKDPGFTPRPLETQKIPGRVQPPMRQADRAIDWQRDSTDITIAKLRAADSAPGIREEIGGQVVFLYGVRREENLSGGAGDFIAHSNGAVCRATVDGAVWIPQARCEGGIKLPAAQVLLPLLKEIPRELKNIPSAVEDIRSARIGDVAYLYFDFAGGAMNTGQCRRLLGHYRELQSGDARVIVLMGGEDFWSNGVHLHCIEAAEDPARESWENINAIDDLVEAIIETPDQITVAALRNNAGAGGAMMALACDHVLLREGVVLNPHYRTMGFCGSEYWTYLLPRRAGQKQALALTQNCLPLLATEALQMGLGDEIFDEGWDIFQREMEHYCRILSQSANFGAQLKAKRAMRTADEKRKPLRRYREEELEGVSAVIFDPEAEYQRARRDFVYKIPPQETPAHLRRKVRFWQRVVFS